MTKSVLRTTLAIESILLAEESGLSYSGGIVND